MAAKQQTIMKPQEAAPQEFIPHHPPFDGMPLFCDSHPSQCSHSNPDLAKLAAKLCQVMQTCAVVPKDKANADQGYKYVSSDAIIGKVNQALVEAKLATVCRLDVLDRQPRTTRTGGVWELVTTKCTLSVIDSETGALIESEGIGQGYDSSDKAFSKAQTQAKKYALMLLLNISTGDDPEGFCIVDEEPIVCKHCSSMAEYSTVSEFEGQRVKVYHCQKCKKDTRVKA
ncbi:MAG TPA: ERF family protein [Methanothrix sp.]|uniref:ERF family protein n=1 Tax=Methanothrix sp. TaxID=90426 RepID=UPI002C2F6FED|nr:ERF family protein [Methanothrix sp.]HQI67846.1 ERF family protein [Methanothrix sp.]HRS85700.1 ERF family protein [Methanothrix sp.]HRU76430.1 ERF family protein [Methanothrix sp.]